MSVTSTTRKRVGGGWKNIQVTKADDDDTGIWFRDATAENKHANYSKLSAEKRRTGSDKVKARHLKIESSTGKDSVKEIKDDVEHKLFLDELDNEKKSEKTSEKLNENLSKKSSEKSKSTKSGIRHEKESDKQNLDFEEEHFEDSAIESVNGANRSMLLPEISSSVLTIDSGKSKSSSKGSCSKADRFSNYTDFPILKRVQDSVIGHDLVIDTPYGHRRVTYCDFTASGRSLSFIEDFIREHVMPTYANTHSTTGHNARQTGKYREEARNIIKRCVNASKDDVVVFTGSGATAGMHKVAWALKVNNPRVAAETAVFIGPYEHHSNILLWREFGTRVIRIRHEHESGVIDLEQLREELKFWKEKKRHLLVCMSAASNVTGIITDVDEVAKLAHQNGALVIFDYAGGGPYLNIDMNPSKLEYKDAVIVSPHKFVGGPGTPGVVIAKKWIFKNSVPDRVGGGTVRFVTREQHAYVGHIEEREEGGTPAIIESVRAGIAFQLKQEIGTDLIHAREKILARRAFKVWEENPSIFVLGSHTADRVTIFSFLTVHQETGRLVHHNFISSLLSDLYGIQARGGCACAGPYAQDLMGISEPIAKKYLFFLSEKPNWKDHSGMPHMEIMKPGFTRINLAYFMDDETTDFIIEAVDMVTKHGWKLLPEYSFDLETGSWHHKSFANTTASQLKSLQHALVDGNDGQCQPYRDSTKQSPSYKEVLETAAELFKAAENSHTRSRISSASKFLRETLPKDKRGLKWFLTPHEAINILADTEQRYLDKKPYRLPFHLQKPSFMFDDKSSVYALTSFPPISQQRGKQNEHRFHPVSYFHRGEQQNLISNKNAGDLHLPKVMSADDNIRTRKHEKRSYEQKVVDAFATPRGRKENYYDLTEEIKNKQRKERRIKEVTGDTEEDNCDPCSY